MHPKFAVIGYPNKGKSTIVANLTLNDDIVISNTPGTTTKANSYKLEVDGKVVYELIDTPGFQRAREVLSWLKEHNVDASKRLDVVKEFVAKFKDNPKFKDEIELLTPIIQGAGVIYVVDASKPYSIEYEAQMEILRWTSAPSMAILNFIGKSDYSKEWKLALNQYFKIVKSFNPMEFNYQAHIDLLEAMSHLKEEWSSLVKKSIKLFKEYIDLKIYKSAVEIVQMLKDITYLKERLSSKDSPQNRQKLEELYKDKIKNLEESHHKKIKLIWEHKNIDIEEDELIFKDLELFSTKTEEIFGLSKKELISISATVGAAIGGGVDLALLGHTFFLGALTGAAVGAVSGYFGANKVSEIKILGVKLGKEYLEIGPIKNINFLFTLLNRALIFTISVAKYSHAKQEKLKLEDLKKVKTMLNSSDKSTLYKFNKKLIDNKLSQEDEDKFINTISNILKRNITKEK